MILAKKERNLRFLLFENIYIIIEHLKQNMVWKYWYIELNNVFLKGNCNYVRNIWRDTCKN